MKYFAWILSFLIGFISLGEEMLWFKVISFELAGIPQAFSFVLVIFLLGIAAGAYAGKIICSKYSNILLVGGFFLITSGVMDLLTPLFIVIMPEWLNGFPLLIFLSASLKSTLFPIVHHLGTKIENTSTIGQSVSKVYFFNILGSTLGSLFVGIILLNHVTVTAAFMYAGVITLILGFLALMRYFPVIITSVIFFTLIGTFFINSNSHLIFSSMIISKSNNFLNTSESLGKIIENRYGVIHTLKIFPPNLGETVYGNNAYDGRINVSPIINSNGIDRVYLLAALHPNPKRILVIGVSGGSWTRVLSSFPQVERIDAVEINKGYLELIADYPAVAPILSDHRIHFYIDDGRRWIRKNPDERYDLIVMNTTYHWRSGITNLLSIEMMELLKSHLNPDGILAFNTTGSHNSFITADKVFKYTYLGNTNFIYASDTDFSNKLSDAKQRLLNLNFSGEPIFKPNVANDIAALDRILSTPFKKVDLKDLNLEIITDDNMITEFKYGWKHPLLH